MEHLANEIAVWRIVALEGDDPEPLQEASNRGLCTRSRRWLDEPVSVLPRQIQV